MTTIGLVSVPLVLLAALSAPEAAPSATDAPAPRSCASMEGTEVLVDPDGTLRPSAVAANVFFADTTRVSYPAETADYAAIPVIAADATMAELTLSTGHCHAGHTPPPAMPPCDGACDPGDTTRFERVWPKATAAFVSCGGGQLQRRVYRRVDGDWALHSLHVKAVETCPPARAVADA